jgi:hypothetical protein
MIQSIGENLGGAVGKCRNDSKVGKVTRGEQKGAWHADESGQALFQLVMNAMVAADQMGGTGAGAETTRAFAHCRNYARVTCQPEVIIAAEGQEFSPIHRQVHARKRLDHPPLPEQMFLVEAGEDPFQVMHCSWGSRLGAGKAKNTAKADFRLTLDN